MQGSSGSGYSDMSGEHQENAPHFLPLKRKRKENRNPSGERFEHEPKEIQKHKTFVRIEDQKSVYCSDSWMPEGGTLYLPLRGPVLVNLHKYEQISFEQGWFCVADEGGRFLQRVQGNTLNCWRFNKLDNKLFIALSYFFTNFEVYRDVLNSIDCL